MTQRILELARTIGQVNEQEDELLITLSTAAQKELTQALREGVSPQDCPESFALAGAWLVLAGLETSRSAGQAQSFSAGEVTIHSANAKEKVHFLRNQARRLMSGWTKDPHFLFCGVGGL